MTDWDKDLAAHIDHTVLAATATTQQVRARCNEAKRYGFACVVAAPFHAPTLVEELEGTSVRPCSVVSFPLGGDSPEGKIGKARTLLECGVLELDMVMNIGALLCGDIDVVRREIEGVVGLCRNGQVLKVIIETAFLNEEQIERASKIVRECGAGFVKTSTGYGPRGATVDDVRIIRKAVGEKMGIKAAGGIITGMLARSLLEAGATRIGSSRSVDLVARIGRRR